MKIAYFHRLTFDDTEQRFIQEAEKLGIELVLIKYKDLVLESRCHPDPEKIEGEGSRELGSLKLKAESQATFPVIARSEATRQSQSSNKITFKGQDIKDFDAWYFRSVGSELEWSKILQLYAKDNNIPVVDDYIITEGVLKRFKSTMGYILAKHNINYPKTTYFNTFKQVVEYLGVELPKSNIPINQYTDTTIGDSHPDPEKIEGEGSRELGSLKLKAESQATFPVIARSEATRQSQFSLPFIVKMSSGGRHGMSTFFVQKEEDILEIQNTLKTRKEMAIKQGKTVPNYRGFLLQEFIPNDGDYRVMTVGYKCIGGFKRAPKEEKLVLNKSVGKSTGLLELPSDVVTVAEQAAKVLGIEVAGTDLVRHAKTGEVYIVEVNEAPQFKVFEKRTKINAPGLILKYLVEKARN